MFTTICNFLYDTFFHRSESKLRRSNNDSNESRSAKRVKFSENFWNSRHNWSSGQKNFPLSLSMQKENADISDDEECCIIAEMPRRKKLGNHINLEKEETPSSENTYRSCTFPLFFKDEIHKVDEDLEKKKHVNNPFDKSLVVRSCAKNKFFNNTRSPLSCGKLAKSKVSFKSHLRRRMNFLQESYRLSEKFRYVQLLRSQGLLGSPSNRTLSRSVSSRSENIPVIDLTDSGEDNSKSDSESQISEDQDVQILGEYRGVRSFQDILKLSQSETTQASEGVFTISAVMIQQGYNDNSLMNSACLTKILNPDAEHNLLVFADEYKSFNYCKGFYVTNHQKLNAGHAWTGLCRIPNGILDSSKVLSDHTINILDDDEDEKSNFDSLEEKLNYVQITSHPLKEIEFKELDLPELTPEQEMRIRNALIPIPKQEILVKGFNLQITRQDMQTLKGLNWLNDVIIDFYMNLIMQRSKLNSSLPKVYAFNTFFYPKLANSGYESLCRWTKHVDIFSFDILLVPVHLGMHWCLSIINFRSKSIQYYDSIGSPNDKCLELLLSYLKAESLHKKKIIFHTSTWERQNVEDIPQQMNGSDCGVFSCMFAEYFTRNCNIMFSQDDMPYFRKKMVIELLNKQLLT